MKLIDKQGKVFGKINLIDLLIILAILAVGTFLALKFFTPELISPTTAIDYEIKFLVEEAPDYVGPYIGKDGALIKDFDKATTLGYVSSAETGKAISFGINSDGQYVLSSKPTYISALIKATGNGILTPNGLVVDGLAYPVGRTLTLIVGNSAVYARIYSIDPAGEGTDVSLDDILDKAA